MSFKLKILFPVLILIISLVIFTGCSVAAETVPPLATTTVTISRNGSEIATIDAEVAETPAQREQGLMFRTELEDGNGMLFIFEYSQILSFWMKNTSIPLSIAFINYYGDIIDIQDMQPEIEASTYSSSLALFALEVPQGWFSRVGVQVGDTIDFTLN